jgi:PAS domain S-box-containing protein
MAEPTIGRERAPSTDAEALRPLSDLSLTDEVVWQVLEAAPDAVVLVDADGRIALANRQVESLFGYDRAELLGHPVETLVPAELRRGHTAHRLRYRAEPRRRAMGAGLELSGLRRDGSLVPVEIALSPVNTAGGVLTIAVVRDVSDRRAAEARFRRVQNALDATRDGVYLFEPEDLRFAYVNEGAASQSGYTREQLWTMTPLHLTPEIDEQQLRKLLTPVVAGVERAVEVTTVLRRRDGEDVPVEMVLQYDASSGEDDALFVAVVRDITERVHAQQLLVDTGRQLALFEDRERIARDLHDRIIQRLFACGLSLQGLASSIDDNVTTGRLEQTVDDIDESIRDLRTVIFGLTRRASRSSVRSEVLNLASDAARSLSFEPRVRFDGPVDTMVSSALGEHLLTVLREALANVAKHARASCVDIDVFVAHGLLLRVVDDGVGMPETLTRPGDGLRNLASRAEKLGGVCRVQGRAEGGTVIEWEVPLDVPSPAR